MTEASALNTTRIKFEYSSTTTTNNNHSNDMNNNNDCEDLINHKLEDITDSAVSSISPRDLYTINNNSSHLIIDEAHKTIATQQSYESISEVVFNSSVIIDNEDQKSLTDISTSKQGHDTSLSNSGSHVVAKSSGMASLSIVDQIQLDHCYTTSEKNPSHHSVVAETTATPSIRNIQLDHDDLNTNVILNDVNEHQTNHNETIGLPDYKDQVNDIRCARTNLNYQKSGGSTEFIINNHTNNNKKSPVVTGMVSSDITTSSYNTKFIEDILEQEPNENVVVNDQNERPRTIDNNQFSSSLSHEIIQSSAMNNKPEQQNIHDEDHDPVIAEAYKVSSLIIEAQPIRRNNQLLFVIIFVMMIAGVLFGILCQNGACRLRSNDSVPSSAPTSQRQPISGSNNDNNNIDFPSSAPTLQRQPISDSRMLVNLVDLYINGTFYTQVDDDNTTLIDQFGKIEYWDVTNLTDFLNMFATWRNKEMFSFNGDINHWNVQNAYDMSDMFHGAASFNGNLSLWDVNNVKLIRDMFSEAKSFQGIGLENWLLNPLLVDDISNMFSGATFFDCNLSNWDVSGVTNMMKTFANAQTFTGIGLNLWNTSQLTNASSTFAYASLFAADLSHWDVSRVKYMDQMFASASKFDSNLSSWDVHNVTDMSNMFSGTAIFKGNGLSNWDVSKVEEMSFMFESAISFNANLSNWNVTMVSSMSNMFEGAYMFNSDLSRWDVKSVVNMSYMFSSAATFNSDLSRWDVSNVRDIYGMFSNANNFNSDLSNWDVSYVTNLEEMFSFASSFTGNGLSNWNVSNVVNIDILFAGAKEFDADLSMWDVSRVTTMRYTFKSAYNFTGTGIDKWNVENVEIMESTFNDAQNFNANLSLWNVTKVRSMEYMFYETSSFLGIGLSEWNVRNVEFFNHTFDGSSIIDVDLSQWDVQSAISVSYMYANTPNFDSNLSGWNVTSIEDFSYMFANATSFRGIGLENWKLNDDAIIDHMFCGADSFDSSYINLWNITSKNVYC